MGPDFWDDFSRKRNVSDGCCLFVSGFLGPGFRDVRQVPLSGGQKRIVGKQNLRASICKNKKGWFLWLLEESGNDDHHQGDAASNGMTLFWR